MDRELSFPVLIGDIGGTNARFQIIPSQDEARITYPWVSTADYESIEDAIHDCVNKDLSDFPKTAILAAAGPITENGLKLTNCRWDIRPELFLEKIGCEQLVLLNDFEAQALALPYLSDNEVYPINGDRNFSQHHSLESKAVVGPGTGLGVGGLIRVANVWSPIAGEGGHVDLGPRTDREYKIWPHIKKAEGRVSAEQALSGAGLTNLYQAVCLSTNIPIVHTSPEEISDAATTSNPDQPAFEALSMFFELLGRVAGDLALTLLPTGGVYLAGGICQKLKEFIENSEFRSAFLDKAPHRELMEAMPVYLVTNSEAALLGLESIARHSDNFDDKVYDNSWSRQV